MHFIVYTLLEDFTNISENYISENIIKNSNKDEGNEKRNSHSTSSGKFYG